MKQVHVEPSPTPPMKGKYDGKLGKDLVKLKLHRYPMSSTLDLYEFKIYLFDNGNPEEFFSFVRNFKMTLAASGMLEVGAKVEYLRTLVHIKALF